MTMKSKTTLLVEKLTQETLAGNITWDIVDAPSSMNQETESSVPLFLQTTYKSKIFGIYDIRTKSFYDEHDYYWSEGIGFCVLDDSKRVVWESGEYSPSMLELFNVAREQASGIDDIFDDLLND